MRDGVRVRVAGREYARDLAPAAATARGSSVTVRLETLTRLLWEKAEAWEVKRPDGALKAALDAYGFAAGVRAALERMAAAETETLILHELGEVRAGRLVGSRWEAMLAGLDDRRAELVARAARDLLADCLVTLPTLLDRGAPGPLHFWFASLDGMRRELFAARAAGLCGLARGRRRTGAPGDGTRGRQALGGRLRAAACAAGAVRRRRRDRDRHAAAGIAGAGLMLRDRRAVAGRAASAIASSEHRRRLGANDGSAHAIRVCARPARRLTSINAARHPRC